MTTRVIPNHAVHLLCVTLLAALAACASIAVPAAEAPEGNISTDRPSFGAGTRTVPAGRLQFELGYTYLRDGGRDTHTVPNTLLRAGVADTVELRASTIGYVSAEGGDHGFGDLTLGARFETLAQNGWVPELALQPSLSLPTGSVSRTDDVSPELLIPMAWALDADTGILANVGLAVQKVAATRETEVNAATSVLVGRTLSDTVWGFAEYFALYPGGARDQQAVDFGATWLWNANLQLDAAFGFGLNDEAGDFFATVGVSHRF